MTTVTVNAVGIATLQDAGRPHYTHLGVPVSGAWNRYMYSLINMLMAGTPDSNTPVIEILAGTLTVTLSTGFTHIACIGNATFLVDGEPAPVDTVLHAGNTHRSTVITVTHKGQGPVYLTVHGLTVPYTLGSISTDTFSRLGPPPMKTGDIYILKPHDSAMHTGRFLKPQPNVNPATPIRIIPHNPNSTHFTSKIWTVTSAARSGTRLHTDIPFLLPQEEHTSGPVTVGTIQITPSGEHIILGPDSGPTGGYPTAGTIITADLPLVASLPQGTPITFAPVTVMEATEAYTQQHRRISTSTVTLH